MKIYLVLVFLIENKCKLNDYNIISAGPNVKSKCFKGFEKSFYSKNQKSFCKSKIDNLPILNLKTCHCTIDDFQWFL